RERYLREAYGAIRRKKERSKATRLEPCEIPPRRGDDALLVIRDKGHGLNCDHHSGIVLLVYQIKPRTMGVVMNNWCGL
ncbi:MAG: hypothetical protein V3W19_11240, partial [Desulfatiglandales bacterium]